MKRAIIAIAVVLAGIAASQGRIITVDDDGPADFSAIQAAIDDANDGDTVLIADGRYTGAGNRDLDFHGKAITVKSQNGPEHCIIDCNGTPSEPHRGFYFHSFERQDSVLSGLTVTNGYAVAGGGIYCDRASPTIENCIIARNQAEGAGGICWLFNSPQEAALSGCVIVDNRADYIGGIYVGTYGAYTSSLTVRNCLIARNTAVDEGGGVGADTDDVLTFEACTFADNSAELGGGLYCMQGRFALRNCILWGNSAAIGPEISDSGCHCAPPCTVVNIYYCDLQGGREGVHADYCANYSGIFFREGNIDADPCFADPSQNDYHLKSQGGRWDANEGGWTTDEVTSVCIDAGDPTSPIGNEPFPSGGRLNMGAYGGTNEASKSYFGEPPCETIVAGDVNGDCRVDFLDFSLIARHWMEDNSPCGSVTTTYLFQADPNALTTSGGQGGVKEASLSKAGSS